jgi:uncharacterized protein (DUF488 family)
MHSILYTIGFTRKTAEEFFQLLGEAGVSKVIDIRENRAGQLQGFARFPDIAYFLDRLIGAHYEYQPLFAPTPEIRTAYRSTRDWTQYEKSFRELMEHRKVLDQVSLADIEGKAALLCSEATPEKCHRRLVAEMLSQFFSSSGHLVEVRHLLLEKPRAPRKKSSKRND